ncbi:MAG: hypothetical protein OIN84_21445 [Candidatus Methanoperedens sp.]|nr:hypothetical protein [Candidatus Methanoperedens nitroreducens]MCX9080540.1 hypothetical protein [Candidatus Methanoperedens sp.]
MRTNEGWGRTPEIYNLAEYKRITLVETKNYPLFRVKKPLSLREWLPLMGITIPATLIPGNIIAAIKEDLSIKDAAELIVEKVTDSLIQEIVREERYSLRSEKKRPWSIKTRRPFRGKIDKIGITFRKSIELAEKVACELGSPIERSDRGRPPVYDRVKLAAALLVKGMRSFVDLSTDLENIQYDMTVCGSEEYPCSSELHTFFQKIPKEWLDAALLRLDELSIEEFSKFSEPLDIFVIDGSALTGETLVEREVLTKVRLIRDYFQYQATIRIFTNTIRCVNYHSNKIADIIPFLPDGSIILADAEFDVVENYQNAKAVHMDLQVKQREGEAKKSIRKIARIRFDKKKYRKRKLGERPFGNIEVRRSKCYYKKEENKLKGSILIACDHNITAYFNNKAWCYLFVKVQNNDGMEGIN